MELLTKEQAFAERDDLKYINIDQSKHDFQFTRRWFKVRNQATWSTYLPERFTGDKPVNMVQVGVFEGADLIWCLQNILTHKDSRAVAIDPWGKTTKLSQSFMDDSYKRAVHNLSPWSRKVKVIRESSHIVLPNLKRSFDHNGVQIGAGDYDLIVIDGDHNATAVYKDAVDSMELIKEGGWILFDDYYNRIQKKHHVAEGVDDFLASFDDAVELKWQHRFSVCFEKI
jgi:predicted O-methyltransferase YrrM